MKEKKLNFPFQFIQSFHVSIYHTAFIWKGRNSFSALFLFIYFSILFLVSSFSLPERKERSGVFLLIHQSSIWVSKQRTLKGHHLQKFASYLHRKVTSKSLLAWRASSCVPVGSHTHMHKIFQKIAQIKKKKRLKHIIGKITLLHACMFSLTNCWHTSCCSMQLFL